MKAGNIADDALKARHSIFVRLFGAALVAHVVGNSAQPDLPSVVGWLNLAVGLSGSVLVIRPTRRLLMVGSALTIGSVVAEMPVTGNHWLVAGLVSAAILVSNGQPDGYLPAARWILIVFYSFAAFAKLNAGFFDPSVSCAVFYANQSLDSWGLPELPVALAGLPIWLAALIELSVPMLLIVRRTRYWGVLLATFFHTVISYDLSQHFYDFTAVLFPLFFAFVPDRSAQIIEARRSRLAEQSRLAGTVWLAIASLLVVSSVLATNDATLPVLTYGPFLLWIPFGVVWLGALITARTPGKEASWRLRPAVLLIVIIVFLNGLTPYTELKTGYGFNMYANLLTADGASNHFVVRQTWPLRDGYKDPVRIVDTNDPGLDLYAQRGYLVAYPQLRRYLASRPEVSLVYERGSEVYRVPKAVDVPELTDSGPWWWRYFPLRALDLQTPPRCQDVFLPAL